MSRLIYNADVMFINAQDNLIKSSKDELRSESFLSIAAFNAQQSMEFYLKGLVELKGEDYIENHALEDNLAKLPELRDDVPEVYELLSKNYYKYDQWEQKGRYSSTFHVLPKDVDDAINIVCFQLHYYCKHKLENN